METNRQFTTEEIADALRQVLQDLDLPKSFTRDVQAPSGGTPLVYKKQPYFHNFTGGWILTLLTLLGGGAVMLAGAIAMNELSLYIATGILFCLTVFEFHCYHTLGRTK